MHKIIFHSERPELAQEFDNAGIWPEFNMHGDVLNQYWGNLFDDFPSFQFVVVDEASGEHLAEGHTVPCFWDGTSEGLPEGIDGVIAQACERFAAGQEPNTLSALAAEVKPGNQGQGLSQTVIGAMKDVARREGFAHLIAPVRPNWKARYPLVPIERYVTWRRADGLSFDPWMRVHERLGAEAHWPIPRSMKISGTVEEWEEWCEMHFPESGTYVIPDGLDLLSIDREADSGLYWEPNVWMVHSV